MRNPMVAFAVVAGLSAAAWAGEPVKVDQPVPDLCLKTVDGKDLCIDDLKAKEGKEGKIVVIASWSTGCPSGKPKLGWHAEMAKWCAEKGVEYVAVVMYKGDKGDAEGIKKYAEAEKLKHPIVIDSECEVAGTFDTKVVNSAYVIDAKGVLRYAGGFEGGKGEEKKNLVRQAVEELLAGKEVSVKHAPPAG